MVPWHGLAASGLPVLKDSSTPPLFPLSLFSLASPRLASSGHALVAHRHGLTPPPPASPPNSNPGISLLVLSPRRPATTTAVVSLAILFVLLSLLSPLLPPAIACISTQAAYYDYDYSCDCIPSPHSIIIVFPLPWIFRGLHNFCATLTVATIPTLTRTSPST